MQARLELAEHLSIEELKARYRAARQPTERSRWQVLWLLAQGKKSEEVAATLGYSVGWVRALARRYNAQGVSAASDGRAGNPARTPTLDAAGQAELAASLDDALAQRGGADANEGELWDGAQVARWISARRGHKVGRKCGWVTLPRLGFTSQSPRPRHAKAEDPARAVFKKGASPKR
jgi:transposase